MENTQVKVVDMIHPRADIKADDAAELLKAMANEHRLTILNALMDGEKSVSELNDVVPISQSALSQHLAWLRNCQLVKTRKQAQAVFYRTSSPQLEEVMSTLRGLYSAAS